MPITDNSPRGVLIRQILEALDEIAAEAWSADEFRQQVAVLRPLIPAMPLDALVKMKLRIEVAQRQFASLHAAFPNREKPQ